MATVRIKIIKGLLCRGFIADHRQIKAFAT